MNRVTIFIATPLMGALLLTGCASSTAPSPSLSTLVAPSMSLAPTGSTHEVTFSSSITSTEKHTTAVGPHGEALYGSVLEGGPTTFDGQSATIDMNVLVDYVSGNGPFVGLMTITMADGSTLGFTMVGNTVASADTSDATFVSSLTVIGGTKMYENASGSGSWSGSRKHAFGTAVSMDATISFTS
ncbi:MAG: hypothetical protein WCI29_13615 [Actinomycetes bacterium]